MAKDIKNSKNIIVQGDYYEQPGNLGAGHISESEIKGKTKLAGTIHEAEQNIKSDHQNKADIPRYIKVIIAGEFAEIDFELLQKIQKICKEHNLKIVEVREGSIELIFEGSEEDIKRFQALIESGELTDLAGKTIESASLIDAETEEEELRNKIDIRDNLVRKIRSQNIERIIFDLSGADLSYAKLRDADLSYANLSYAKLRGADLSYANLSYAKLRGADLRGAKLSGTFLRDADLSYAKLSDAHLSDAKLSDAHLSDAKLSDAHLSVAKLSRTFLRGTDLSDADLSDADLSDADLSYADLSGANLSEAKVDNARFGYNSGISETIKRDLKSKGAIFVDYPGDRSEILTPTKTHLTIKYRPPI